MISRLWLEPWVNIHPAAAQAISQFDAAVIGPGSFYTSLMPIFLVRGAPEAIQQVKGPVVLVCNLLTEGRGMWHFTAGEAVREMAALIGRPIDVVLDQHVAAVRGNPRRAMARSTNGRSPWATCPRAARS